MRGFLRWLMKKTGLYLFIRYSAVFRLYERTFKPHVLKEEARELRFYKSFLGSCKLVFDIGAYDGHKTAAFLSLADQVISCEPDEYNFRLLSHRFGSDRRVRLMNVALDHEAGQADFHIHHPGSAFGTLNLKWKSFLEREGEDLFREPFDFTSSKKVTTTTLDRLIMEFGVPNFIKIDVEGNEWNVLQGLNMPVSFISFEANLPEFREETILCINHLFQIAAGSRFNYSVDEKLELAQFVSFEDFLAIFSGIPHPCVEIICKMES